MGSTTSSQKFIARNRAPRVQIEYDVELYGAEKKVQLPFVMGVMADCGINVTYSYSLISTYIALSVKDIARAEKLLAAQPVELIGQDDLARPVAPESR